MIAASGRRRDELIALVASALGRATVERIAVNAVMAGCRPELRAPEHLQLVVAGGTAGPFAALIPGWPFADSPARLVTKKIAA